MQLTKRFEDALGLACRLHADQARKGGDVPYVSHLLGVASLVLEHGGNEDEAIAALLHDAVEDQGGAPTLEKIRAEFGERVAQIVAGCTDSCGQPKPPWRERKEGFVARLATAGASVLLVASCDKLHNARALLSDYRAHGEALWQRFRGGRDGTLWYYRSLVVALGRAGALPLLVAELDRVVSEIERLSGALDDLASG